jgi:hypothetical protein
MQNFFVAGLVIGAKQKKALVTINELTCRYSLIVLAPFNAALTGSNATRSFYEAASYVQSIRYT